ncbi:uncharacterized protein [Nicotiana tomentosiformis]|uniref:uncharacterized protein n=1 Tax=Nicotiana tomentosiformis TaxID=4098 RepID=UPI00388CEAD4
MAKETGSEISFQTAANVARRIKMVISQDRGPVPNKRPRHSGNFRDSLSGGRGTFSRGNPPRPFYSALQTSHGASGSHGPYAPVASLYAQLARGRGQAARGGGQTIRGGGQVVRGGGQPVRGCLRDVVQSGKVQPRFYAFPAGPEAESSNGVITGIVPVFHRDASVLFDPGSTYSYVSSYFASYLVVPLDSLSASMHVSTSVGDSIVVDHVYRLCVVTIGSLETSADLLLLDMVDFDVILGMDMLSPYHAILDCHTKIVTLAMPRLRRLEWEGTHGHLPAGLFLL